MQKIFFIAINLVRRVDRCVNKCAYKLNNINVEFHLEFHSFEFDLKSLCENLKYALIKARIIMIYYYFYCL